MNCDFEISICACNKIVYNVGLFHFIQYVFLVILPGRVAQSVGHLTHKSEVLGFDTRSSHILSFLLPLIQEGQLSVTGESMCTKYWLTA